MRTITKTIVGSFLRKEAKSYGNTCTNGKSLFLHGNEIARHTANGIEITNAGWSSNTTKERLNALPGVVIHQKDYQWYLNGFPWDGSWKLV